MTVRLLERVHLVGSGWLGYSLSDRHDSHVYLVDGGTESVLVDAGSGLAAETVAARVRAAGAAPVTRILLTHGHADHAAGAAALGRLLGARICASREVARMLADADEVATGLAVARSVGTYPEHLSLTATTVDEILDGTPIAVGEVLVTPLPTPGHAAGHLSFLAVDADGVDADGADPMAPGRGLRAVFTGDLVFARGRVAVLGTPDVDLTAMRRSIESVAATGPVSLFPGHGSVAVTDASAHLDVALTAFARGALPPGLLP